MSQGRAQPKRVLHVRIDIEKQRAAFAALPPRAFPTPLERILRDKEVEYPLRLRYLECPHYSLCLDYASECAWISFICTECPLYRKGERPYDD